MPGATRQRVVEVHTLANEVKIFEEGLLIAAHPVLDGATFVDPTPAMANADGLYFILHHLP